MSLLTEGRLLLGQGVLIRDVPVVSPYLCLASGSASPCLGAGEVFMQSASRQLCARVTLRRGIRRELRLGPLLAACRAPHLPAVPK